MHLQVHRLTRLVAHLGFALVILGVAVPVTAQIRILPPTADLHPVPVPVAGSLPAADPSLDLLHFRNGDRLHGQLLDASPDAVARWYHAEAAEPIAFSLVNIIGIDLGRVAAASPPPANVAVVLTNDDLWHGRLTAMSGDQLQLDTWYAGPVGIPRVMLRRILPRTSARSVLYVGPNSADEWQQPGHQAGSWQFHRRSFYARQPGMITKQFALPDQVELSFDLAWRNYPQLQLALYTDNLEQVQGNCYMLQVSGHSVYLQRGEDRRFHNIGGSTSIQTLQRRSHARFTIYLDRTTKRIALFINNELVKQWVDGADFAGRGNGVIINSHGQGPVRLSNVLVREWSGEYPSSEPVVARDQDVMRFINGDKVSGRLKEIRDDTITFETAFAPLEVPVERVIHIELATVHAERARRRSHDIVALLHDGGRVTFELGQIGPTTMTGRSENFGQLEFVRAAFRELQFHIYDETISRPRDEGWDLAPDGAGLPSPPPMIHFRQAPHGQ